MSYGSFLGEAIAEHYRTGQFKKPNPNNKIGQARSKFRIKLENEAAQQNRPLSDVALDYVQSNSGQLSKYIMSKGELPQDENPEALARQAYELRKLEVQQIAEALGSDLQTAEVYLDEAENQAMEINSPEADSFIGELFEAVGRAAAPGVRKAADKRAAAGKKPGIVGFLANILDPNNEAANQPNQNVLGAAYDEIVRQQKKQEIKKMLPMIILSVVALIVIVILITRKASK